MNEASTPLLEVNGISKRFPGVVALQGVSFSIGRGEILGLIGENGAGKSTLMKILGGVHEPDEGNIRVDGQDVTIRSVSHSIALGIAFIHQELNVLDNLDVAGNVYLGREPLKGGALKLIDRPAIHRQTGAYLQRLGLNVPSDTPLSNLSLAQQQMVEIAKALSLDARLIIMDEPTSSLTLSETERLLTVAEELGSQGVSIIYISHRLAEVERIADRVVVLRDGRKVGEMEKSEVKHERMISLMVGRDLDRFYAAPEDRPLSAGLSIQKVRTQRYPAHEVSLEVNRGEILGLAGLVGAGRSELARAVFGADPRLGGTVSWEGKPLAIKSPRDSIRHGIFLVPEDRRATGLITDMRIRENVTLPALGRLSTAGLIQSGKEQTVASDACRRLNVKAATIEVTAATLSGGNQQKVVLAKWLSLGPKALIFDEPTRGIDVGAKAEIYHLMRGLADEGVAILMISSDMEEVLGVSDRVAVMHEGRVTGVLARAECTEEAIMRLAVGRSAA
ncbi:MAG TPA: sugar ABC transporter ATP-binding protein [Capsulimonadaceae bacterium]|nr:sugar ABC transporter ATP-binding protein [Capsulimonadaceae bacterium]